MKKAVFVLVALLSAPSAYSGVQSFSIFPCKAAIFEIDIYGDNIISDSPDKVPVEKSPYEISESGTPKREIPIPDVQPGLQETPTEEPSRAPDHVEVPDHVRKKIEQESWKTPEKPKG